MATDNLLIREEVRISNQFWTPFELELVIHPVAHTTVFFL